jgi:hypothetical protein
MPLEAIAWLLTVMADTSDRQSRSPLADELSQYLIDHVSINETTGAGFYYSYYADMVRHELLHSDVRTDAVILEALVVGNPKSVLIPKLVRGLCL